MPNKMKVGKLCKLIIGVLVRKMLHFYKLLKLQLKELVIQDIYTHLVVLL